MIGKTGWVSKLGILGLALWGLASSAVADSRFDIQGLEDKPLDNVKAFLPAPPLADGANNLQFLKKVRQRVTDALQAVGYYNADIQLDVLPDEQHWIIRLVIDPGPPTTIGQFNWSIAGAGAQEPLFFQTLINSRLKEGAVLNHAEYESLKSDIQSLAYALGYLDSLFVQSQVIVEPKLRSASVSLHFDTGERYALGALNYSETPFDKDLIERLSQIDSGALFTSNNINQLYQDLINSRYFQSVTLTPNLESRNDGLVPVDIELSPRSKNIVSTGIGASTNLGPRFKVAWDRPWINRLGHRINSALEWSQPLTAVRLSYQVPLESPLHEYITLSVGWNASQFEDIDIRKQSIGIERQWVLNNDWTQTFFMRWDKERSFANGQHSALNLYIPGGSWTHLGKRPSKQTDWFVYRNLRLEVSNSLWGSDVSLAKAHGQFSADRMLVYPHSIQFRGQLGAILGAEGADIPPSMRFFAGGDQSIRGFAYNSIGPAGAQGALVGGRNLIVGSIEYGYLLSPSWRSAWFVDAGNAFDEPSPFKVGVGTGLHWLTPVGTVRFDAGFGVSEPSPSVRLHLSFGMEL